MNDASQITEAVDISESAVSRELVHLGLCENSKRMLGYHAEAATLADAAWMITSLRSALTEAQRDVAQLSATRRWNIAQVGDVLEICRGDHEKAEGCQPERYVRESSPTACEKQRDDARAILKNIAKQWPDSFAGESARAHLAKGETK